MKKSITLSLDIEIILRIEKEAKEEQRSVSFLFNEYLKKGLDIK